MKVHTKSTRSRKTESDAGNASQKRSTFAHWNTRKAKPVSKRRSSEKSRRLAPEGEYMAGEADNVLALTTAVRFRAGDARAAQAMG